MNCERCGWELMDDDEDGLCGPCQTTLEKYGEEDE